MMCSLCEQEIDGYSVEFNHLAIDEGHAVEICSKCIDKFLDWHANNLARMFPTKAMKKKYGKTG